jgi:hypothetical protein
MFGLSAVTGKLHDEGYTRHLLIAGSIIYAVCVQMVSLAHEYYSIFLAQGLGMGLGIGASTWSPFFRAQMDINCADLTFYVALMFLPAIGAVSHFFMKRRALATGIVVSGSSIGGICFPISENNIRYFKALLDDLLTSLWYWIVLNHLFQSVGFGWGVRASGFLILGCLVAANLLIHTRLPPRKDRPAHMQFEPDMSESVVLKSVSPPWAMSLTHFNCAQRVSSQMSLTWFATPDSSASCWAFSIPSFVSNFTGCLAAQ